jgi:hypothetical protein
MTILDQNQATTTLFPSPEQNFVCGVSEQAAIMYVSLSRPHVVQYYVYVYTVRYI